MYDPNQLPLWLLDLIVKPTQHTLGRAAVVVLHKVYVKTSGLIEGPLVKTLEKETTSITEDPGLND
jgi:hypothetical protein